MPGTYAPPGTGISFTINESVFRDVYQSATGQTGRWLFQKMNRVRSRAVGYCPVDTGRLRSSITSVVILGGPNGPDGSIGANVEYATYVHEGRGPVRPVRAKVLRWVAPGGEVIFRPYAGPAEGQPFLLRALEDEF